MTNALKSRDSVQMDQHVSDSGQVLDVSVQLVSKVKDVTHVRIGTEVMVVRNVYLVIMGAYVVRTHGHL